MGFKFLQIVILRVGYGENMQREERQSLSQTFTGEYIQKTLSDICAKASLGRIN